MLFVYLFLLLLVPMSCVAQASAGDYVWYDSVRGHPYNVTYDNRSFIIDGRRTLLLGGEVHYPRFAPYQWSDILTQMKQDGLNHVQIYIFWNLHEHDYNISSGVHTYDFTGRADLAQFLTVAAKVGLFVNVRIGPYVCAEWNFGGLPLWLKDIPGIKFRDYNQPWMDQMETFVRAVAKVLDPFLAKNSGPIVLAQIENEYRGSKEYVDWCGQLADNLDFQIPWVMCNGDNANNTINTYNGDDGAKDYAEWHEQTLPQHPLGWTENEGWLQEWGTEPHTTWDDRTPQDMANVIAKWFAVGAAHHNYYMYYGGNHVGLWAAAALTNMYADGTNYHSDTTPNEPKRSHLNRLHQLLLSYNDALMSSPKQLHNATKLNTTGNTLFGFASVCDATTQGQKIDLIGCDSQGNTPCTIQFNNTMCLVGDANADPVAFKECDSSNANQNFKWIPSTNQLQNLGSNQCLDLDISANSIDMWSCKDSSDASNQRWTSENVSGSNQLRSEEVNNMCVTATIPQILAYSYGTGERRVVFMTNTYTSDYNITWEGRDYAIPAQSVTIVDYQGTELYQTSKVNLTNVPTERVYVPLLNPSDLEWQAYTEDRVYKDSVSYSAPQEQLSITRDKTEYLIYSTQANVDLNQTNNQIIIETRKANAHLVFINGEYKGQTYNKDKDNADTTLTLTFDSSLTGPNTVDVTIVSISLGIECLLQNQQGPEAQDHKGIVGQVTINNVVLSGPWSHRPALNGEELALYTSEKSDSVSWTSVPSSNIPSLTWFRTKFDRPSSMKSDDIVLMRFISDKDYSFTEQSRGHFYLNGFDLGRYWGISANGKFDQTDYFIPGDLIQDKDNLLVYVDECGSTHPRLISFASTHMEVPTSELTIREIKELLFLAS